jgi:hypothetical protein
MTLQGAVDALCNLQLSLQITDPFYATIKAAYPLPPNRAMSGLPDVPCWINVWGLTETMNWGQLRIERYAITMQLFVPGADTNVSAKVASAFATAFIAAWDESDGDLEGQTVGTQLRARDPSVVNMEWGGQSYAGIQFTMDIDVPVVVSTETYVDDGIQTLIDWTAANFPLWQQNPATWKPSDVSPAIYWHYVTLPTPIDGPEGILSFEYGWQGCTVAARIITPGRIAATMATSQLSRALGKSRQDYMVMPDGSYMNYNAIRAYPDVDPAAEGQLQMNVKFILDESLPPEPFGPFPPGGGPLLTWQEDPSVGNGEGPTITIKYP